MLSRFYVGTVSHGRGAPAHGFSYRVWYAWLDLDGIDEFCSSSLLISKDKFNLLSYCRQDYLPGEGTLGDAVRTRVAEQTGAPFTGKVFALTTLRQLGVCMNPISLYYCYPAAKSEPGYVVVEVHNTPWGERHSYVLAWDEGAQEWRHAICRIPRPASSAAGQRQGIAGHLQLRLAAGHDCCENLLSGFAPLAQKGTFFSSS